MVIDDDRRITLAVDALSTAAEIAASALDVQVVVLVRAPSRAGMAVANATPRETCTILADSLRHTAEKAGIPITDLGNGFASIVVDFDETRPT